MAKSDLLQGTLDLLLLKVLALGPNHGWGISNRIRQMSGIGDWWRQQMTERLEKQHEHWTATMKDG